MKVVFCFSFAKHKAGASNDDPAWRADIQLADSGRRGGECRGRGKWGWGQGHHTTSHYPASAPQVPWDRFSN